MKKTLCLVAVSFVVSGCFTRHRETVPHLTPAASAKVGIVASSVERASSDEYFYRGINFGSNRDADFKQGVVDGCKTAKGEFVKNSSKFKNNESYKMGWGSGRIECGNIS